MLVSEYATAHFKVFVVKIHSNPARTITLVRSLRPVRGLVRSLQPKPRMLITHQFHLRQLR